MERGTLAVFTVLLDSTLVLYSEQYFSTSLLCQPAFSSIFIGISADSPVERR